MVFSPALFSFNFLLLFLFLFNSDFNSRNDKGPFFPGQSKKSGRKQMQFMKAIVSNIRFTITFID